MSKADADREAAAFLNRAKWVVTPVALAGIAGTFALARAGSGLVFTAFYGLALFAIGWNVFFMAWRHRLRRKYVADEPEHRPLPRRGREHDLLAASPKKASRWQSRLLQGARAMVRSTDVEASSWSPLLDVQLQLANAADVEGATHTWRPTQTGVAVEWHVHPNVRNRIFMNGGGELRQEGAHVRFAGTIRPDAPMVIGVIPTAVFGIGGIVAIAVGVCGLLVASGDKAPFAFFLASGLFGTVFSAGWILSHSTAFDVHERILRSVFGDSVWILRTGASRQPPS